MLCSITARSSTCGARGCRPGVQAGVAGWGCRLGLPAGRAGCRQGLAGGAHRGAVVERGHLVGREGGREGRHLLLAQGSRHAAAESVRSEGIPTCTTHALRLRRPAPTTRYGHCPPCAALPALPSLLARWRRARAAGRAQPPHHDPVPRTPYPVPRAHLHLAQHLHLLDHHLLDHLLRG